MVITSQLIKASIDTGHASDALPMYTVDYEVQQAQSGESAPLTTQPLVKLFPFQNGFIHIQFLNDNTLLRIQPLFLLQPKASERDLCPVSIRYATPIVLATLTADDDGTLIAWLLTRDNQLIRQYLYLNDFCKQTQLPAAWAHIYRVRSIVSQTPVSLSVTSLATVTIGTRDGSTVHLQYVDQHPMPAFTSKIGIVHQDDVVCEYVVDSEHSFLPLLAVQRLGTWLGFSNDRHIQPAQSTAVTSVESFSMGGPLANIVAELHEDQQLTIWSWNTTAKHMYERRVDLPQLDVSGGLIQTSAQCLTSTLPGSFNPKPHVPDRARSSRVPTVGEKHVRILRGDKGHCKVCVFWSGHHPYFAVYDLLFAEDGSLDTLDLCSVANCPVGADEVLSTFTVSISQQGDKESMTLWSIWDHKGTMRVWSTTLDCSLSKEILAKSDWTLAALSPLLPNEKVMPVGIADIAIVDTDTILVAVQDKLFTNQHLSATDVCYNRHWYPESEWSRLNDLSLSPSIDDLFGELVALSKSIPPKDRQTLESTLKTYYTTALDAKHLYKIAHLQAPFKVDPNDVKFILKQYAQSQSHASKVHGSPLMLTFVSTAFSQVVQTRFDILLLLVVLLCAPEYAGNNHELQEAFQLLRVYDALRWISNERIPGPQGERLLVHIHLERHGIALPSHGHVNVGDIVYGLISQWGTDDQASLLDLCGQWMASEFEPQGLHLANGYFNTADSTTQSTTTSTIRFYTLLRKNDFQQAAEILETIKDAATQKRLLAKWFDEVYHHEQYQLICGCPASLKPLVSNVLADWIASNKCTEGKRLTPHQLGFAFFTLSGDSKNAHSAMHKQLSKTRGEDKELLAFFV